MLVDGIAGLDFADQAVVVVGSGPVGLALAANLAQRGIHVLLLESGGTAASKTVQSLSAAESLDPARHDDMEVAVARRLGGTSNLWCGRCLPYDPIDFADRAFIRSRWPIGRDELEPYFAAAADLTQSGAPIYHIDQPLVPSVDSAFRTDTLERWSNVPAAQNVHRDAIQNSRHLHVRTHATVTALRFGPDGQVVAIEVAHSLSGEHVTLPVSHLVIAAGGLETARMLLSAAQGSQNRFGSGRGPLGRYYMGHVIGEIGDIIFPSDAVARAFDYTVDEHGSYVRRRIVPSERLQFEHRILNSAFWPVVPPLADWRHGSAILSLVYLALSYGPLGRLVVAEAIRRRHVPKQAHDRLRHLVNVISDMPHAATFAADFMRRRYDRTHRLPAFFSRNKANRYGLSFHAEHAPHPMSRIWLSGAHDRLGVPKLAIDLRFSAQDVDSLVKTHDLLERWLADTGLGRIEYRMPKAERGEAIMRMAAHGTHQIGLARMGANRREAVVDRDLRSFDAPNLYLATTAVLPTSGQANPTFTTIALALRLADHLAAEITAPHARTAVG